MAVLKAGTRATDPNYDGVNVYGDETTADIRQVLNGIAAPGSFSGTIYQYINYKSNQCFPTGYTEQELLDPNTLNFKLGGSLHYKITPNTEAILAGYWGTGNTVYTGASRYSIKDFKMGQYKFELNNKNWMFRAYTTQENAGETYNLAATTQNFNEAWKPSPGSYRMVCTIWPGFSGCKTCGHDRSRCTYRRKSSCRCWKAGSRNTCISTNCMTRFEKYLFPRRSIIRQI